MARKEVEQIRAMKGIVRHARNLNPATDIVFMYFVDLDKIKSYHKGEEPKVIQNHEKFASHYNIPTINIAKEVTDRIDAGEFTWEDDFKDLHPSPFGQGVYASSIIAFLDNAWTDHLSESTETNNHFLPEPIDRFNYNNGILIDVSNAKFNGNWKIDPQWKPKDGQGTRNNYTNVPMLIGEKPNAGVVNFIFKGNTIGIAVAAGPDAGIIEYRIDRGQWQKLDLLTRWSKNLHLSWFYTLGATLENTKHRLQIRIAKQNDQKRSGNACRIRYFYINE